MSHKDTPIFPAIDDRSGFKTDRSKMVREPGTKYFVNRMESDGRYNLKDHPLNFPPKAKPEQQRLRYARNGSREDTLLFLVTEDRFPVLTEDGELILIDG